MSLRDDEETMLDVYMLQSQREAYSRILAMAWRCEEVEAEFAQMRKAALDIAQGNLNLSAMLSAEIAGREQDNEAAARRVGG